MRQIMALLKKYINKINWCGLGRHSWSKWIETGEGAMYSLFNSERPVIYMSKSCLRCGYIKAKAVVYDVAD